jgi:hypothetical protein
MISIPVVVHNDHFKWQLDLFWHRHKKVYGDAAAQHALALVIERNLPEEKPVTEMQWDMDVPHNMCKPFFECFDLKIPFNRIQVPLNIQAALYQSMDFFGPDDVLEIIDGDMFHMHEAPPMDIGDNELYVDDVYEGWHLFSLSTNRDVIARYFQNGGRFYNGGFVPIIGRASTIARILPEWIAVHAHILTLPHDSKIQWWAGMFALQAACEKAKVRMIAKDFCYIPGVNTLQPSHYIAHYSVDKKFDKRAYPKVNTKAFDDNPFYAAIEQWMGEAKRPWHALTEEEIDDAAVFADDYIEFMRGVQWAAEKLKEKNQ